MSRGPSGSNVIWEEGFENGLYTPNIWERVQNQDTTSSGNSLTSANPNGTATRTTLPAGSGYDGVGKACRFEIRDGDVGAGSGCRSELSGDGKSWRFREGDERVIQFRIKFASNWTPGTAGDRFNIFCQFHAGVGSPPMSVHIGDDSRMYLDDGGVSRDNHIAATGAQIRRTIMTPAEWKAKKGQWIDFNLRVKFSNDMKIGGAEVHIDGVKKLAWHNRQTMASSLTYMKIGQYRYPQPETNVVWFDDMRLTSGALVGDTDPTPVTGAVSLPGASVGGAASSTQVTVNRPAGTTAGEMLMAIVVNSDTGDLPPVPTGWTAVKSFSASQIGAQTFYKIASSSEPASYTFDSGSLVAGVPNPDQVSASITRISGFDPVTPFDNPAKGLGSGGTQVQNILSATHTTVTDNALVLTYHCMNSVGTSVTVPPPGQTKFIETGTVGRYHSGWAEPRPVAGAVGDRLWDQTLAQVRYMGYIRIVIRPKTVGAPDAPTVDAGTNGATTTGTAFTRTANENNGGSTITSREWTVESGPAGVGTTIGTAAALNWTPTVAGTYVLRYTATNAVGTGTATFTLTATAPNTIPPRTRVQMKGGWTLDDGTNHTSLGTPVLSTPASAGNLLIAAWSVDLDAGAFTPPTGWKVLANRPAPSVSLLVCYKIAAGGETSTGASWTTPQDQANSLIAEYSGVNTENPVGPSNFPGYVDVQYQDITLDLAPASVEGMALAFIAAANTRTGATFTPAAAGWGTAFSIHDVTDASAGLAVLEDLAVAAGDNKSSTFTWTALTRRQGFIVLLNAEGATAPPPPGVDPVPDTTTPLSWPAPTGYTSYPVKTPTSTTGLNVVDGGGGDVWIKLPANSAIAPIRIQNCRNAVLIGGQINMLAVDTLDSEDQRGIHIRSTTGTVHVEGVLINGNSGGSGDGFAINATSATLQIQNVRVQNLRGISANHADVFQPWGGCKEYRIDRLTGSSNYQGLHVGENLGEIGKGTIKNTNIFAAGTYPSEAGHLIWMNLQGYPLTLDNVYIKPRAGRTLGNSIWPQSGEGAVVVNGVATWPNSLISGSVKEGDPSAGDFAPASEVGLNYVSPTDPDAPPPPPTVNLDDPVLKEKALRITSTAENGTVNWWDNYAYIEDIADGRGYTAGIVGWCSGTGDMLELIKRYNTSNPGNGLEKFTDELTTIMAQPYANRPAMSHSLLDPQNFTAAWATEAAKPAFQAAQEKERDRVYWAPALAQAKADEVGPLGLWLLYDISVNHGPGTDAESFGGIVAAARASSPPPSQGGNETAYLRALDTKRTAVLTTWGDNQTNGRDEATRELINAGELQLAVPVTWHMYGTAFTMATNPTPRITDPGTPPPAPTGTSPTLNSRVVGFPEIGQGRVAVNTTAVRVRLRVGTDPAVTTNIVYGPYATPNAQGDVKLVVGLPVTHDAGEYFYRVAMVNSQGGEWLDTKTPVGRLLTAPTGRVGLTVSAGSCTKATDSAAILAIANRTDDLFAHLGDMWYADGSGTGIANYRSKMDEKLRAPNHARLFATTPSLYTPSDHDYGMANDALGPGTAGTSWNAVFREKWPHPALAVTGTLGCYWTRPWGTAIRLIVLDTRSFASKGSTKLGSTQKTWLKTTISNMTEDVALIFQDGVWIGPTDTTSDDWPSAIAERNEIGDHIAASGKKVVWFGGDAHALAVDNGTNSRGGFPVYQCAPLNNSSSQKGGPYSGGQYPSSGTAVVQQYGRLVVTLGATTLTCAFTGYSSDNTVRKTLTTTFPAKPAPPVESGPILRVWNGTNLVRRGIRTWNGTTLSGTDLQ